MRKRDSDNSGRIIDRFFIFLIGFVICGAAGVMYIKEILFYSVHIWVTDFRAFYTGAYMLRWGISTSFYHLQTQFARQQFLFPRLHIYREFLPFLYPPYAAFFFLPLLPFSLPIEYDLWAIVNIGIIAYFASLVCKLSIQWWGKYIILTLLLTFFPVLNTLILGQMSLIIAVGIYASFFFLQKKRYRAAGLALGVLYIKPQYALVFLCFLLWKYPKAGFVFCIVGIVLVFLSFLMIGGQGLLGYAQFLYFMSRDDNGIMFVGIENTWRSLINGWIFLPSLAGKILIIAGDLGIILAAGMAIKRTKSLPLQWSLLTVVAILISPHANYHDLALLIIPAILVFGTVEKRMYWFAMVFLGYVVCLLDVLFMFSVHPLHLSVFLLLFIVFILSHHMRNGRDKVIHYRKLY